MHLSISVSADDVPTMLSPQEGDEISSQKPQFVIETSKSDVGVDFYFEVADNPDFNNAIVSGPVTGQLNKTFWIPEINLDSDTEYFWRVKASNSAWTDEIGFHINGKVHLSPNPYRPLKHGEEVVFRNVPDNATIIITTVNGELVQRLHVFEGSDVTWDVTNDSGAKLSSGVYLYYINSNDSATSGKFAVIK